MATTEQTAAASKMRRRIGPGMLMLVAVLAMFVLLLATFAIGSFISSWQLRAELDKIRAAGEPATTADMDALYAYPPQERDTTQLWLDAFAVLESPAYQSDAKSLPMVGEGVSIPQPDEPWPQLDAADALLTKYREPLKKMHQAAKLGGRARFPVKFAGGIATQLPHVPQIRGAARLLQLEAEMHARHGDPRAAAESVRAIFAAARTLEREPLIVSQLVRIAMNSVACSQLERLLPAGELAEEDLLLFDRELAASDELAAFRRSLLGERAIGIQTFANPSVLSQEAPATLGARLSGNADEAAYLQLMARYVAASNSADLPLREAILQTEDEVSALLNSSMARLKYPRTKLLMPSLRASAQAVCRAQALQAAARTAIAIERYRRVHGETPKTLGELAPEFLDQPPVDPFDGAPLRYKNDAAGYRVYSIGPDGIDQGGASGTEGMPPDIVFELKLPEKNRN